MATDGGSDGTTEGCSVGSEASSSARSVDDDITNCVTSVVDIGDTIMVASGTDVAVGVAVDASAFGMGIACGILGPAAGADPTAEGEEAIAAWAGSGIATGVVVGAVVFVCILMNDPSTGSVLLPFDELRGRSVVVGASSSKSNLSCKRFRLVAC